MGKKLEKIQEILYDILSAVEDIERIELGSIRRKITELTE